MSQPVCALIDLLVSQMAVFKFDCSDLGILGGNPLKYFVNTCLARESCGRFIPSDQNFLSLRWCQQRQVADPALRIGDNAFEQGLEMGEPALDGLRRKQAGIVPAIDLQTAAGFNGIHIQVKACRALSIISQFSLEPGKSWFLRDAIEIESCGHEGHPAGIARARSPARGRLAGTCARRQPGWGTNRSKTCAIVSDFEGRGEDARRLTAPPTTCR